MASDTYFNHVHRRLPASAAERAGSLTFPPLYIDPNDPRSLDARDGAAGGTLAGAGMVLGSTYYHHPQLQQLVSHMIADSVAQAPSGNDSDSEDAPKTMPGSVPQPRIANEFIALNEDLVPAPLDLDGDTLPSEQHPSYPFGNLFSPTDGMLSADSAIMGGHLTGLKPEPSPAGGLGLDLVSRLGGSASSGRRGAVPSSWNASINRASRSKVIGSGGASNELESAGADDVDAETIQAAKRLKVSPLLMFRTGTATVLAPPSWPFRRFGPGSTSYAALLRPCSNIHGDGPAGQAVAATLGGLPASAKILREVWTDLALEELVPQHVGPTSSFQADLEGDDEDDASAEAFARRIATLETDPLDRLGPIARELRGQAAQVWGTGTEECHKRKRGEDEPDADRMRYGFSLAPIHAHGPRMGKYGEELGSDEDEDDREPDSTGWETAKRIWMQEERDRVFPSLSTRSLGRDGYRIRGARANYGVVHRPGWTWGDELSGSEGDEEGYAEEPSDEQGAGYEEEQEEEAGDEWDEGDSRIDDDE